MPPKPPRTIVWTTSGAMRPLTPAPCGWVAPMARAAAVGGGAAAGGWVDGGAALGPSAHAAMASSAGANAAAWNPRDMDGWYSRRAARGASVWCALRAVGPPSAGPQSGALRAVGPPSAGPQSGALRAVGPPSAGPQFSRRIAPVPSASVVRPKTWLPSATSAVTVSFEIINGVPPAAGMVTTLPTPVYQ